VLDLRKGFSVKQQGMDSIASILSNQINYVS